MKYLRHRGRLDLVLFSFTLLLSSAWASTSLIDEDLPWQVFETEHFRVHFTPELKDWALAAANEMEVFQSKIQQEHQLALDEKIDALVVDTYNTSQGFALPLSYRPSMTLFATPTQSDLLSNHPGWHQILSVHEYIHLVHLGQKSRNQWRDRLSRWMNVIDMKRAAMPLWVIEGYATLMESKLTGRGRLNDHAQDAQLKQLVYQGRFPIYSQIEGRLAYSVGARFLHWIELQYGEEKLDQVWIRFFAVRKRSYEQAFEGVYLKSPETLYQEFAIHYIEQALTQGKNLGPSQSELWFEPEHKISSPVVSPNGSLLALLATDQKKGNFLSVYETQANEEAKTKFEKEKQKLLKKDPQDVPDAMPLRFPQKRKFQLNSVSYPGLQNPRWQDDNHLLFTAYVKNSETKGTFELHRWNLAANKIEPLTSNLGVKRFDVSRNGQFAVVVASQNGYSQLLKAELTTGQVTELSDKSLARYFDFPRLHPNQTQLAYLSQSLNELWQLQVRDLNTGQERLVPMPKGYQFVSFPEWSRDGQSLLFVASELQLLRLYEYQLESDTLLRLTSGKQSVFWSTPLNEHNWLHLAPGQKGAELYRLDISKVQSIEVKERSTSAKAPLGQLPALGKVQVNQSTDIGQLREYSLGKQQGSITYGVSANSASNGLFELGYHSTDLLQRMTWQVNLSQDIFDNKLKGASFDWSWNPWAVDFHLRGYHFDARLEEQVTDYQESGLMLEASALVWTNQKHKVSLASNAFWHKQEGRESQTVRLSANPQGQFLWPSWKLNYQVEIAWLKGYSDQLDWQGQDIDAQLSYQPTNYVSYGTEFSWKKRNKAGSQLLSLGGYPSNLISAEANPNRILSPELTFAAKTGDEYKKVKLFAEYSKWRPEQQQIAQLFYQRQLINEQNYIDSYGVTGKFKLTLGVSLLNGLTIEAGIARVDGASIDENTEAWLGLFQPW